MSLTIADLLDRSLAGLRLRSDRPARKRALSRAEVRPGLATVLLAGRARQEAELLVRHYRGRPADLAGGEGWSLDRWTFHR